jgi:NAD(P)-dependent dehydrogenase (short-subunit alcohol dehydrogenase family)
MGAVSEQGGARAPDGAAITAEDPIGMDERTRRHVLVTGGSSGIGSALVRAFADAGYGVTFTYHHGKAAADDLASELEEHGVRALPLDLADPSSHDQLLAALSRPIDVLINNAGLGSKTVSRLANDPREQERLLLHVNATGTLWLTQAVLPSMLDRGSGTIILISSVGGGITAFPGFRLADGMSKAAIAHLGRQLAAELAPEPIDVFVVCPGATDTPMFHASTLAGMDDDERARFEASLAGGRMIHPREIADLCLYLCTPAGRVLRGAVLDASLGLGVRPGLITETTSRPREDGG